MTYRVIITPNAEDELRAAYRFGLCAFEDPIRELFYGSGNRGTSRILFAVPGQQVYVLHVRHGSMLPVEPDQ